MILELEIDGIDPTLLAIGKTRAELERVAALHANVADLVFTAEPDPRKGHHHRNIYVAEVDSDYAIDTGATYTARYTIRGEQ